MSKLLSLDIVTQENRLLQAQATRIMAQTDLGEITILPGHVSLVTSLSEGILRYYDADGAEHIIVVFGGFLELNKDGLCTVLVDSAIRADDIDTAKVKAAQAAAEQVLQDKAKQQEYLLAESALRQAALKLKAADRRTRHN